MSGLKPWLTAVLLEFCKLAQHSLLLHVDASYAWMFAAFFGRFRSLDVCMFLSGCFNVQQMTEPSCYGVSHCVYSL